MRRFLRVGLACAGALLATWGVGACRAIVGIEELDLEADAGGDASADARANDAAPDASPDAGFTPDTAQKAKIEACKLTDCRKCCKTSFKGVADLEQSSATRSCMCGAWTGPCEAECNSGYCGGGQPSSGCAPCVDDKLVAGECDEGCTSSDCQAGLACLRACPPR